MKHITTLLLAAALAVVCSTTAIAQIAPVATEPEAANVAPAPPTQASPATPVVPAPPSVTPAPPATQELPKQLAPEQPAPKAATTAVPPKQNAPASRTGLSGLTIGLIVLALLLIAIAIARAIRRRQQQPQPAEPADAGLAGIRGGPDAPAGAPAATATATAAAPPATPAAAEPGATATATAAAPGAAEPGAGSGPATVAMILMVLGSAIAASAQTTGTITAIAPNAIVIGHPQPQTITISGTNLCDAASVDIKQPITVAITNSSATQVTGNLAFDLAKLDRNRDLGPTKVRINCKAGGSVTSTVSVTVVDAGTNSAWHDLKQVNDRQDALIANLQRNAGTVRTLQNQIKALETRLTNIQQGLVDRDNKLEQSFNEKLEQVAKGNESVTQLSVRVDQIVEAGSTLQGQVREVSDFANLLAQRVTEVGNAVVVERKPMPILSVFGMSRKSEHPVSASTPLDQQVQATLQQRLARAAAVRAARQRVDATLEGVEAVNATDNPQR